MVGSDGEKIGKITEIYEDPQTGKPEWATVSSGLFGTKTNFVPLAGASPDGRGRPRGGDQGSGQGRSRRRDRRRAVRARGAALFEHYGVPYTTEGSTTAQGQPNGDQP